MAAVPPSSLAVRCVRDAAADLQRTQFDAHTLQAATERRSLRRRDDIVSLGGTYFWRTSAHAFRRGEWGKGIAACLPIPFCAVGVIALDATSAIVGDCYSRSHPRVPNTRDVRKFAAVQHLREVPGALTVDLTDTANQVLRGEAISNDALAQLHFDMQQAIEDFAGLRDRSDPAFKYSHRLANGQRQVEASMNLLPCTVARVAYNNLAVRLLGTSENVAARMHGGHEQALRVHIAAGDLTLESLDTIDSQLQNLVSWVNTLPAAQQPEDIASMCADLRHWRDKARQFLSTP